ncbi:MAG: hypothetical protein CFH37_00223 [Alphaproteobacteria bacterium MarineAlpha9_Bin7]|nr:MAG: hypothetical protein CFH37_00223 [Alphaproteobacteria bacterium MarineAlpha9_Bin7]
MARINIEFSRFSAFYTPLIMTMAGNFLQREGLEPEYTVSAPGTSAIASLLDDSVHVVQSAPSQAFAALEKGEAPLVTHFAQINETDGFFLNGRTVDPEFSWSKLVGKKVLVDHGGQPLAMFKYACFKEGIEFSAIQAVDAGTTDEMEHAFRDGEGDYIHAQGPTPQQLEKEGVGHVVASVGEAIGVCAFSSLAATRDWQNSDMASTFMMAYRDARKLINSAPASEIAKMEMEYFPGVDVDVLTDTIGFYQRLGCWTPHVEITREAFEGALNVFLHAGSITTRHDYELAVSSPPAA